MTSLIRVFSSFLCKGAQLRSRCTPLACEGELVTNTWNSEGKVSYLYIVEEVIFLLLKKWSVSWAGNPVSMRNNVPLSIHFIFLNKYMI